MNTDAIEFGVRIERDTDFDPGNYSDQEELNRECAAKLASGEWTAYGIVGIHRCGSAACGGTGGTDAHDTVVSVWGFVVDDDDAERMAFDLTEIDNEFLRESAREIVEEARALHNGEQPQIPAPVMDDARPLNPPAGASGRW